MFTEDITAIIIDPGSTTIRSGYSGEDTPHFINSSFYGAIETKEIDN